MKENEPKLFSFLQSDQLYPTYQGRLNKSEFLEVSWISL